MTQAEERESIGKSNSIGKQTHDWCWEIERTTTIEPQVPDTDPEFDTMVTVGLSCSQPESNEIKLHVHIVLASPIEVFSCYLECS